MFDALIALTVMATVDVPACEYEDGSTQTVCITGVPYGEQTLNLDHGRITVTLKTWHRSI